MPWWVEFALALAVTVAAFVFGTFRAADARARRAPRCYCTRQGSRHHGGLAVWTDGDPLDPATRWHRWEADDE